MLLRQPDPTTCGSCCAVRARMELDDGYDAWVRADVEGARFREESLAAHRRTNRPIDARGRLQPPWPLALGTAPWALARELSLLSGSRHIVHPVLPRRRADAFRRLREVVAGGHPAPVYVGNALSARHVVLALPGRGATGDSLTVYDPTSGRDVPLAQDGWVAGSLRLSGWDHPWFVVAPTGVSPGARRTRA